MPCRSRRASISCLPRESFDRSRRPSGARGGADFGAGTTLAGMDFGGTAGFAMACVSTCGASALAARCLRNGLTCFATLSHSARSSALRARLRRSAADKSGIGTIRFIDGYGNDGDAGGAAPLEPVRCGAAPPAMAPARPPPVATGFEAADPDVPDFAAAGPLAESLPVAAAGTSAGLSPFLTILLRIDLRKQFCDLLRRPLVRHRQFCGTYDRGSRLFGTSITNRMLWRRRPDTFPGIRASAEIEIGARRADDRGAGVLRDHQPAERRLRMLRSRSAIRPR